MTTTLCFLVLVHICISSRHYLIAALGTLFLFVFLLEINYLILYGQIISEGVLDSIVETNSYEALSMAKQVLMITGPAVIATFLILFIFRKVVCIKFKLTIPLTYYVLGIFLIVYTIINTSLKDEIKKGYYKSSVDLVRTLYPAALGNVSYLFISFVSKDIYSNTYKNKEFNEAILLPPKDSDNELVVLIMGESSLVTRYSAYGYSKSTTPFMSDIFSQNKGCIIYNSHSAASLTRDSLPMTLSFNVPESDDNLFINKSIIEMANFNNYKTYWLASVTQGIQGSFNTKFGFIARQSDVVSFSNDNDDINLSKLLEEKLQKDSTQKKFIFIHLRGSH
ncbi:MAG: sulfatase-like hydrolase/transferase, partial [Candidatus Schmidhempelia sp.]|nr:sulfatase-like hydrolase/transferase [Candidatus Schmidhempelia sp.]